MVVALRRTTTVLPGSRIEVAAPELPEGTVVELIVLRDLSARPPAATGATDVLQYLDSLPENRHSDAEWEAIERELREGVPGLRVALLDEVMAAP